MDSCSCHVCVMWLWFSFFVGDKVDVEFDVMLVFFRVLGWEVWDGGECFVRMRSVGCGQGRESVANWGG